MHNLLMVSSRVDNDFFKGFPTIAEPPVLNLDKI